VDFSQDLLQELFQILIVKSKWDSEDEPYSMDEDEKAQFETLRRVSQEILFQTIIQVDRLQDMRTFMEIIYAVEADMVATALCTYTVNFFNQYEVRRASVTWQDVELAVYLVMIYGEVCKGVYRFHPQYASDQVFHF
jgi:exportin-T